MKAADLYFNMKDRAELAEKQRDELLDALITLLDATPEIISQPMESAVLQAIEAINKAKGV